MGTFQSFASSAWLLVRSLLATALLPGVVAGYVPWRYFGLRGLHLNFGNPIQVVGLVIIGVGTALLAACIWEFAHSGRGTLAPLDPPRVLVVRGLYRYVRNPMYLAVTAIVLGEAVLMQSRGLFFYWAAFFAAANVFVLSYEEPALRRRFGDSYKAYAKRVGRWLPRIGSRPTLS